MVELLLRSFVKEDLVDDLDFSTLKRLPTSYVTDEFRERESYILWEVTLRGRTAYIFLLIEFQSTVDRFMAVRLLSYLLLFYESLIKAQNLTCCPPSSRSSSIMETGAGQRRTTSRT